MTMEPSVTFTNDHENPLYYLVKLVNFFVYNHDFDFKVYLILSTIKGLIDLLTTKAEVINTWSNHHLIFRENILTMNFLASFTYETLVYSKYDKNNHDKYLVSSTNQ